MNTSKFTEAHSPSRYLSEVPCKNRPPRRFICKPDRHHC